MVIKKNGMELRTITLQQFSANVDILVFEFEKPEDFTLIDTVAEIIYETDKLNNLKNENVVLTEDLDNNKIRIEWTINDSITLTAGTKKVQIIIKNGNRIYLTNVFLIKVLESLQVDDEITITNLTYLEYWEERIKELVAKVEDFEGLEFDDFATDEEVATLLLDYFTKAEVTDALELKADKTEVAEQLEQLEQIKEKLNTKVDTETYNVDKPTFALKSELTGLVQDETYQQDKQTFALKTDLAQKANTTDVYTKSETYTKTEVDSAVESIDISDKLQDYALKTELTEELAKKVDNTTYQADKERLQPKTDETLQTDNKTVTGAINELNTKITNASEVDLSNYYNKGEVDTKVNLKQNKDDNALTTNSKNIVGAINELKTRVDSGAGGGEVDLSNYYDKGTTDSKLAEKQDKTDISLNTTAKTIAGAINELKNAVDSGVSVDLSNYYNKTQTDEKLDLKADKSTVDSINSQLENKADVSDIPTNVSQLSNDSEYITANDIVGGNGIEYTSVDKTIKAKVDESTINFDENGALTCLVQGGGGSVFKTTTTLGNGVEVDDTNLIDFSQATGQWHWTQSTDSWYFLNSSNNSSNSQYPLYMKIDTNRMKTVNSCVLEVKTYMYNIENVKSTYRAPYLNAILTVGAPYNQDGVKYSVSLGYCRGYYTNSSSKPVYADYSNNDKIYYVAIPEIYLDNELEVYLNFYAGSNTRIGYVMTSTSSTYVKAVKNTDYNTFFSNENSSSRYFIKAGPGSNSLSITNNLQMIKYPSYSYNNVCIGNNILDKMGSEDTKYNYYNTVVGQNILNNSCTELQYSIVVGNDIDNTGNGSYPNYEYLQKASYATYVGYGVQPTDQSTNETAIGYYAKGHGDNTVTLGNTSVTGLYCQATAITQSCDPRLKENIEEVDINTVVDALMQIKVIRASYRNLEEFKGSNENDKNKLMWDAENLSNIPLFAKDVKAQDKYVTPLNNDGTVVTKTIQELRTVPVATTLDAEGNENTVYEEQLVDVEVPAEKELIQDCKEFTPNQIMQALVVGFQEQQRQIEQLKTQIAFLKK